MRQAVFLRVRERRGDYVHARVPVGIEIPLVEFEPHTGRGVEQGGVERIATLAAADHRCASPCNARQVLRRQRLHFRLLHAGGNHCQHVGDDHFAPLPHRDGNVVEPRRAGEPAQVVQIVIVFGHDGGRYLKLACCRVGRLPRPAAAISVASRRCRRTPIVQRITIAH